MKRTSLVITNEDQRLKVLTSDGKTIRGTVNISGFDRLSDYLGKHNDEFIMIYNAGPGKDKTLFLLKKNLIYVEAIEN